MLELHFKVSDQFLGASRGSGQSFIFQLFTGPGHFPGTHDLATAFETVGDTPEVDGIPFGQQFPEFFEGASCVGDKRLDHYHRKLRRVLQKERPRRREPGHLRDVESGRRVTVQPSIPPAPRAC